MGINKKASPTLLSLVSKWAVSNALLLEQQERRPQIESNHQQLGQVFLRLEQLPKRVIEQILSLQSASSLECFYHSNNLKNENNNSRKLLYSIINKCFKRLVDIQFGEPLIYSKLQTKQGQLLKLENQEGKEEECDYCSIYFESYVQKCLVNVLSERQVMEFVIADSGSRMVDDTCQQFLNLRISDGILNLAFEEFDENNEIFHHSNRQIFTTIGDCISRYANYSKKMSIPKTLLKYLDESCLIEEFFNNFTHLHEISFRDMRDSDVEHIIHILKQCNSVESLSFYHSFFTETNLSSILDIYSDCIFVPPLCDYSIYFSDDILKKKENNEQPTTELSKAMVVDCDDDEYDFYSDVLSPSSGSNNTEKSSRIEPSSNIKKREHDLNLFAEDETDSKKRKTDPPKLKKLSFLSISLYPSSCKAIREVLEYNATTTATGIELTFSFNEMSSQMANEMLSGESISNITKLILTENNVENDFLIHLSSQKQFFNRVKYLDLSNNNLVGTDGVNALFTALNTANNCSLEHLNISHNKLGGTDLLNDNYRFVHQNELSKLTEYLTGPNCTNFKEFLLSNCDLTPSMVESLLLSVANNASLITLDISNTHSLRLCGTSLSLMLASNSNLKKISMSTCSLHEISDSLFNSLQSNSSLHYIDLSGNRFKERGGNNIITYLRNRLSHNNNSTSEEEERQYNKKHQKQMPPLFHMNTLDLSSNALTEQFCLQLTQLFSSYHNHNHQSSSLPPPAPLIDILLLENNFFSPHITQRLKQAALDSFLINRIVLTNEDGSSEVFSNVCDGTTLT